MTDQTKKYLFNYGIFSGIIVFMFAVLFLLTIFSRNAISNNLKKEVSIVLENSFPNVYSVKDEYFISNHFNSLNKVYELENIDMKKEEYAVVVNVATIYGQFPAVFLYSQNDETQFVNFLCLDDEREVDYFSISENSSILHWINYISNIFNELEK